MGLLSKERLVNTSIPPVTAQTFEDVTTGLGGSTPPSGGGGSLGPSGKCFQFFGSAGNGADTTEDTLATFNLPANALNGSQLVHIYAYGTYANNANTKAAKLYFGNVSQVAATGQNVGWSIEMWVGRSGASAQQISAQPITGTSHGGVVNSAGTNTDTAAITIKLTGQDSTSANANAIVLNGMFVDFMN